MSDSLAIKVDTVSDTDSRVDLHLQSEPFEVTPSLVAANLSFGGGQVLRLPGEMMGAIERIWQDRDFTWPTTLTVTRITLSVEPVPGAEPPQQVWSRVSVLGTGFSAGEPVTLSWGNAFGFPNATIPLPNARADDRGFFGVDLILRTVPKRHDEFVWDFDHQLVLVAEQSAGGGGQHRAEQRGIPPHVVWQWAR